MASRKKNSTEFHSFSTPPPPWPNPPLTCPPPQLGTPPGVLGRGIYISLLFWATQYIVVGNPLATCSQVGFETKIFIYIYIICKYFPDDLFGGTRSAKCYVSSWFSLSCVANAHITPYGTFCKRVGRLTH